MAGESEPVLFVGGPWDGKRRVIESRPYQYEVSLHSMAQPYGPYYEPKYEVVDIHRAVYKRYPLAEGAVVYLHEGDRAWRDERQDTRGFIIRTLLQGYRNL